jgi:hypothetical protein
MDGFDIDWVMDLDILSFDSLVGSIHRIRAQDVLEKTNLARAATNATAKQFKEIMEPYKKAIVSGTEKLKPGTKTAQDFTRKYGRGF